MEIIYSNIKTMITVTTDSGAYHITGTETIDSVNESKDVSASITRDGNYIGNFYYHTGRDSTNINASGVTKEYNDIVLELASEMVAVLEAEVQDASTLI